MDAEAQEFTDCFNKSKGVGRMLETSRSAARVGSTSTGTHPLFNIMACPSPHVGELEVNSDVPCAAAPKLP